MGYDVGCGELRRGTATLELSDIFTPTYTSPLKGEEAKRKEYCPSPCTCLASLGCAYCAPLLRDPSSSLRFSLLALQPSRSPNTAIAFLFSPSPYTLPLQGGGKEKGEPPQGGGV